MLGVVSDVRQGKVLARSVDVRLYHVVHWLPGWTVRKASKNGFR